MTERQSRTIKLSNADGDTTTGTLNFIVYSKQQRMARGLAALGICWGLAAVTLFIPIAHFVLVPGFLIAGPVAGFMRYRLAETLEEVTGECPTCHEQVTIPVEANDRFPKWTYCSARNDPIQLSEA